MPSKCFLIGIRRDDVSWLDTELRHLGKSVVDAPNCQIIRLHYCSDSSPSSELFIDRTSIDLGDVIFFFGVPTLPTSIDVESHELAYAEWRAALETVLDTGPGHVINGSWVLRNSALRNSDAYWTGVCQRLTRDFQAKLMWPMDTDRTTLPPVIEAVITRRGIVTVPPSIEEITYGPMAKHLFEVQDLLYEHNLDFLRTWILVSSDGTTKITRSSAELPRLPSACFLAAVKDLL